MRVSSTSKKLQSGQAIVLFTLMVSTVLIPMVGLAIDGCRGYLVRLKLSSAVDGGALAAARLLGTGATSTIQYDNTIATAKQFVSANFPPHFFGADIAGIPDVCVDPGTTSDNVCHVANGTSVSTYKVRTVVVSATAQMPTFFMRLLGMPTITVASSGLASRRDVRVVLVMDRSSSMGTYYSGLNKTPPSINDLALDFVNGFSGASDFGGRDEVGLVVFGGSAIVAYPPRNITKDYTDYTQFTPPDNKFKLAGNIPTYIADIKSGSNTGTAEALYLAYSMLRADANTNPDLATKLNVIVLFTDGLPNGITAFANEPLPTAQYAMMKSTNGCTNLAKNTGKWSAAPLVSGTNKNMIGWFAQWGGYKVTDTSGANGLFPPMMAYAYPGKTGKGDDIDLYMLNPNQDNPPGPTSYNMGTKAKPSWQNPAQAISQDINCDPGQWDANGNPVMNNGSPMSMAKFPDHDLYGNYTDLTLPAASAVPTGGKTHLYENGALFGDQCAGTQYLKTDTSNSCQIGLASWQAAAHQAWKIWNQVVWDKASQTNIPDPGTYQSQPIIFTIGFDHSLTDHPDMSLLQIIANDSLSPAPFTKRMNGQAFLASNQDAVKTAFQQISSQILRLSQ